MIKFMGFVFFSLCLACNAQSQEISSYYLNAGLSIGNFSGGQAGINLIANQKVSLQLEYSGTMRRAKNTPDDYSSGLLNLFDFNSDAPKDMIHSFRIMPGIISKANPDKKLRMNIKAGISFLTLKEPVNWVKVPMEGWLFIPNYDWDYQTKHRIGIVLKPDFEIVTAKFIGMSISPCLEIAEITTFSVAFNLITGKVEGSKVHKT